MIFTACRTCNAPIVDPYEAGDESAGCFDRQQCQSCGAINYVQLVSVGGTTLTEAEAENLGLVKRG